MENHPVDLTLHPPARSPFSLPLSRPPPPPPAPARPPRLSATAVCSPFSPLAPRRLVTASGISYPVDSISIRRSRFHEGTWGGGGRRRNNARTGRHFPRVAAENPELARRNRAVPPTSPGRPPLPRPRPGIGRVRNTVRDTLITHLSGNLHALFITSRAAALLAQSTS